MVIRVDAYTSRGVASGVLLSPGPLRAALDGDAELPLDAVDWQALDDPTSRAAGQMTLSADDVLIAVADDDLGGPVHSVWHHVRLESGPYTVEGELATMPGFDPGRALTRPSGEFVLLRDVRLSLRERPDAGTATGDHALVNRYAVERIQAELMLGFFFPGATVDAVDGPGGDGVTEAAGAS
jgi:hypothetical protein